MSNNFTDLRTHTFKKGDNVLVDTNIWVFTYGPVTTNTTRTQLYSASLREMRTYNCNIFVDGIVISEFINACARLEYNLIPGASRPAKFKDFRNSANFEAIAAEISINVNKILKITKICKPHFDTMDIGSVINDFATGKFDFNDLILEDICKTRGMTLLTDDADFSGKGIDILTANNKLQYL